MAGTNKSLGARASAATAKAKSAAQSVAEDAKETAAATAKSAIGTAKDQANATKENMADEVLGVASALRTAADEMRSGSAQERTFGQLAEGLADASDALRDKDLGSIVSDVSDFARKNPLVFLGGAALVGFAATRFVKASTPPEPEVITHNTHTNLGDYS